MAWNEPGGNENDPWKNRNGQDQGPPELDEVFKSILGKFGSSGGSHPVIKELDYPIQPLLR